MVELKILKLAQKKIHLLLFKNPWLSVLRRPWLKLIQKKIHSLLFKNYWLPVLWRPWLLLPPNVSHTLSPYLLKIYSLCFSSSLTYKWKSFNWRGLHFINPLGTAGGMDKNALHIKDWQKLGVGFCEIGTITPEPQTANPQPILDRSLKHLSLWNNMGFPNKGLTSVISKLKKIKKQQPLFINIGKNRNTSLDQSIEDYKKALISLYDFADVFVINISSPNTKHLKSLSSPQLLKPFLKSLQQTSKDMEQQTGKKIPLILKLSPDETQENFICIIEESLKAGIDGWCIHNSTSKRPIPNLFPAHGGLSGKPLKKQSLYYLKQLKTYLDKNKIQDKLIISCGGVFTAQDVKERIQEGAHLVQVYSVLIFEGPGFFKKVLKRLSLEATYKI